MAVIDGVAGLSVKVVVDEHAVDEYDDEDHNGSDGGDNKQVSCDHTITKYIEATSGAEFTVYVEPNEGFTPPSLFKSRDLCRWKENAIRFLGHHKGRSGTR